MDSFIGAAESPRIVARVLCVFTKKQCVSLEIIKGERMTKGQKCRFVGPRVDHIQKVESLQVKRIPVDELTCDGPVGAIKITASVDNFVRGTDVWLMPEN